MAMNLNAVLAITASVTGAQAVDALQSRMSKLHGAASTAAREFSALSTGIGNFIGIAAGSQFALFAKSTIDTADNLNDLSQRTGVAIERLSQFSVVAQMSGTNIGAVAIGMKKLSGNIVEAANGNQDLIRVFDALGVKVRNADGTIRDAGAVMLDLSDQFRMMEDGAVKSAVAVKLFGKAGDEMIPMLNEGSAKVNKFKTVISSEFAKAADEFNDNMARMSASASRFGVSVGESALPALNRFIKGAFDFVESMQAIGATGNVMNDNAVTPDDFVSNLKKQFDAIDGQYRDSITLLEQKKAELSKATNDFERGIISEAIKELAQETQNLYDAGAKLAENINKAKATSNPNPWVTMANAPPVKTAFKNDTVVKALGGGGTNDAVKTLNNTLNQTNIIVDDLWKRSQTFSEGFESGLSQVGAMAHDVGGAIEDAMTGAFRNAEDAFVSFVQTGKVDFSSLVNSMIADLARAQFRQLTSSVFGNFDLGNAVLNLFGGGTNFAGQTAMPGMMGRFAMGTDYAPGGLSLVGESGPELVRLPRGASVTPNHKLGGMGGTTINQNFTFTGGVTEKDLARILPEVSKAGANMALSQIAGGRLSARMA